MWNDSYPMNKPMRRIVRTALMCAALGLVPSLAHVAPSPGSPKPWALLAWDQDVGRIDGQEADSAGPTSFALKPDGGALVLDQVNRRVLELDAHGHVTGSLPLPTGTYDDVEQFDGKAVLVLDRLVGKLLRVTDRQGTLLTEMPLEGHGIERAGLVTAMLPRPDGVWLEVAHRHSVKVLDRELKPCERRVIRGRPMVNGQSLHGELDGQGGVRLFTTGRADTMPRASAQLRGLAPVERIVWLDSDDKGRVYAVLHEIERSAKSPFGVTSERYRLVTLDEKLREVERAESPWLLTRYHQRGEFRLGPDGVLWQMAMRPEGVALVSWTRRAP